MSGERGGRCIDVDRWRPCALRGLKGYARTDAELVDTIMQGSQLVCEASRRWEGSCEMVASVFSAPVYVVRDVFHVVVETWKYF